MDEAVPGLLFALLLPAGLMMYACGSDGAHTEYRRCLQERTTVADSVVVRFRPECKKWLQPEVSRG